MTTGDGSLKVLEAINAGKDFAMLRQIGPKYCIDVDSYVEGILCSDAWGRANVMVYMHTVVPNPLRLGLLSDPTRSRWQQLRMLSEDGSRTPDLDRSAHGGGRPAQASRIIAR